MKNRFVKFKSKNKNINKYIAILLSIVILVCFIFFLIWSNYKNFRDSIINNEQENLLTIAGVREMLKEHKVVVGKIDHQRRFNGRFDIKRGNY